MILLDPSLGPSLDPDTASKRTSAWSAHPDRTHAVRSLTGFLRQARRAVGLDGEVSVLLTNDKKIRALNRLYRQKDKPTDVLSFPADALVQNLEKIAGDLAISVPMARRQAGEHGHSLDVELRVLLLHGLLHLAGYDHEIDDGEMARRELALRKKLGLPLGLIERAGTPRRKATAEPSARRAASGSLRMTGLTVRTLPPNGKTKRKPSAEAKKKRSNTTKAKSKTRGKNTLARSSRP